MIIIQSSSKLVMLHRKYLATSTQFLKPMAPTTPDFKQETHFQEIHSFVICVAKLGETELTLLTMS
jgi:hypothetical protein